MITFEIDTNEIRRLEKEWARFTDEVPGATLRALIATGLDLRTALRAEFDMAFDRPTPYIHRSLIVTAMGKHDDRLGAAAAAATDDLAAGAKPFVEVWPNDRGKVSTPGAQVLKPHLAGGERPKKRTEMRLGAFAIPTGYVKLDKHGNIRGGEMKQIMSALAKSADPMEWQTSRSRARNKGRRIFFQRGSTIYERRNDGTIRPMLALVASAEYSKRLDWQKQADRVVENRFGGHFVKFMTRAVGKAKKD